MNITDRYKNALAGMIDHSQLMPRSMWAEHLRVSEAAITYWVQEETIPQPIRLKKIIDKIENSNNGEALQYLNKFKDIIDEPVQSVTNVPQKFRHAQTISQYLLKPNQEQLGKTMDSLPHAVRLRLLEMTQELVASCFEDLRFKGRSQEDVLEKLRKYEAAEDENETFMQIFANFYVLLVKVEPNQMDEIGKPLLKKLLSGKDLLDEEFTGAILELDEPDHVVNPFKDIDELKQLYKSKSRIAGQRVKASR